MRFCKKDVAFYAFLVTGLLAGTFVFAGGLELFG
jgi:hypothetical protein